MVMQGAVGCVIKDKFTGKFVDEWNNYLKDSNTELDTRDVSAVMAGILARKEEEEVRRLPSDQQRQLTVASSPRPLRSAQDQPRTPPHPQIQAPIASTSACSSSSSPPHPPPHHPHPPLRLP